MTIQALEQEQLAFTYKKLLLAQQECAVLLQKELEQGKRDLDVSGDDIRMSNDNWGDRLDSFAVIEMKNREMDQRRFSIQMAEKKLNQINRLLVSPYFGKIDVLFDEDEDIEPFYIGINGFTDENHTNLIYDWRSPIAELFYNNELGDSSYEVNNNEIPVSIENRRQLVTEGNELKFVFDTAVSIDDEVLLSVLEKDATSAMQDITASIQKEQNLIIRDEKYPIILVNGVAGSGKTSVIMQRIAYLLYRNRQDINENDVLILSPNESFIKYVSEVLPSLGEKNPLNLTFRGLLSQFTLDETETEEDYFNRVTQTEVTEQTEILRSHDFVKFLKEKGNEVLLSSELPVHSIKLQDEVIIDKEKVLDYFKDTPKSASFLECVQGVKMHLDSLWEETIKKESLESKNQDQLQLLSEQEQRQLFGKLIPDTEEQIMRYTKKMLRKKYRSIPEKIKELDWLDTQKLVEILYQEYTGKPYQNEVENVDSEVIYLLTQHLFVEKLFVPRLKFLFIDEAQDYTPAQICFIKELFPKAKITMVGDEDQGIFNSVIDFSQIETIMESYQGEPKTYNLQKSYRSSGLITQTFNQLRGKRVEEIIPIQPLGEAPVFVPLPEIGSFKHLIETNDLTSATIITKTIEQEKQLVKKLGDDYLRSRKLTVTPVSLAKGLEFDHVILYDVSKENYQTAQDKRLLYTAVSRAMKTLMITYQNDLVDWLK